MSEAVREIIEEELEEQEPDVLVLDDASAVMMVERIREANDEYERMEAWYKQQLKRMKEKRDSVVSWAEGCLKGYFEMVPHHKTKTQQSYDLPGAQMVLKDQEASYETDDDVLIPWLKKNGLAEFVQVKESSRWGDLKKKIKIDDENGVAMLPTTGEVIPGIKVTAREQKFTVRVK